MEEKLGMEWDFISLVLLLAAKFSSMTSGQRYSSF
jgi:hypothetical protein